MGMSRAARQEAEFWNTMGPSWERWEPVHQYGLACVDPYLIRALAPRPGQRILDVGCGTGEPALSLAPFVAPGGVIVGIDVSKSMIEVARRRARSRRIRHARFRVSDVQRLRWGGRRFDGVVSRFALMFAENIDEALARIAAVMRPGGRIAIAVWGTERDNPAWPLRTQAAKPFMKEGEQALPKRGFSPLRFANPEDLVRPLHRAGFGALHATGAQVEAVHQSAEMFARFTADTSMRELYLSLGSRDRARLLRRLETGARRFSNGNVVRIPGSAWVISGRRGRRS